LLFYAFSHHLRAISNTCAAEEHGSLLVDSDTPERLDPKTAPTLGEQAKKTNRERLVFLIVVAHG